MPSPFRYRFGPFTKGMNTAVAPALLGPDQARSAVSVDLGSGEVRALLSPDDPLDAVTLQYGDRFMHYAGRNGWIRSDVQQFALDDGEATYYTQNKADGTADYPLRRRGATTGDFGIAAPASGSLTATYHPTLPDRSVSYAYTYYTADAVESNPFNLGTYTSSGDNKTCRVNYVQSPNTSVVGIRIYRTMFDDPNGVKYLFHTIPANVTGNYIDQSGGDGGLDLTSPLNWGPGGHSSIEALPYDYSPAPKLSVIANSIHSVTGGAGVPGSGIIFAADENGDPCWCMLGYPNYWPLTNRAKLPDPTVAIVTHTAQTLYFTENAIYAFSGVDDDGLSVIKTNAGFGIRADAGHTATDTPYGIVFLSVHGISVYTDGGTQILTENVIPADTFRRMTNPHAIYRNELYLLFHDEGTMVMDMRAWPNIRMFESPVIVTAATQTNSEDPAILMGEGLYILQDGENKPRPWSVGATEPVYSNEASTEAADEALIAGGNQTIPEGQPYKSRVPSALPGVMANASHATTDGENLLYIAGYHSRQGRDVDVQAQTKAAINPNVANAAAAAVGQFVYLSGGTAGGGLSYLQAFDSLNNTWESKANLPLARYQHASAAVGTKVYVMGGFSNNNASASVLAYDTLTDTWESCSDMPVISIELYAVAVGTTIYVILSDNGVANSRLFAYDTTTDTWSEKTAPTAQLRLRGLAEAGGKLYAVGGYDNFTGPVATCEEYDIDEDTWTTKASMSVGRFGLAVVGVGGLVYAIGGDISQGSNMSNACEVYDPLTNAWTTKTNLPTPRSYPAAAAVGNAIYVLGGMESISTYSTKNEAMIITNLNQIEPLIWEVSTEAETIKLWSPDYLLPSDNPAKAAIQGMARATDGAIYLRFKEFGIYKYTELGVTQIYDVTDTGIDTGGRMAFGPDGKLYVANHGAKKILRYDPTSGTKDVFVDLSTADTDAAIQAPESLAFDEAGTLYYMAADNLCKVVTAAPAHGEVVVLKVSGDLPEHMPYYPFPAMGITEKWFYVAARWRLEDDWVDLEPAVRISRENTLIKQAVAPSYEHLVSGLAFMVNGDLYAVKRNGLYRNRHVAVDIRKLASWIYRTGDVIMGDPYRLKRFNRMWLDIREDVSAKVYVDDSLILTATKSTWLPNNAVGKKLAIEFSSASGHGVISSAEVEGVVLDGP